jgi:hypothetical protein
MRSIQAAVVLLVPALGGLAALGRDLSHPAAVVRYHARPGWGEAAPRSPDSAPRATRWGELVARLRSWADAAGVERAGALAALFAAAVVAAAATSVRGLLLGEPLARADGEARPGRPRVL